MTFQRFLACVLGLLALVGTPVSPLAEAATKKKTAQSADEPATSFKGMIVMDAATGAVLLERNADAVTPPASMTKLMTFAVIHDKLSQGAVALQTPVTIDVADYKIGGTQVWLEPGETFPVEELLYAMMIRSANDAAHALARHVAGSPRAFVQLMNEKARSLGMNHTTFRSPHGLPPTSRRIEDGDLTSARDFAILSRYLLTNTDILKYTSIKARDFGAPVRTKLVRMDNHNHLVGKVQGVDGLKTGFTEKAGYCLSATGIRNGHRVIGVLMGCPTWRGRDDYMIELLEDGFSKIPATATSFVGPQLPAQEPLPFSSAPAIPGEAAPEKTSTGEEPMIKLNLAPSKKSTK